MEIDPADPVTGLGLLQLKSTIGEHRHPERAAGESKDLIRNLQSPYALCALCGFEEFGLVVYLPARVSTMAWPKRAAANGPVAVIMNLSLSTGAPVYIAPAPTSRSRSDR